jgi:pullulanase
LAPACRRPPTTARTTYPILKPLLANPAIKPAPADIAYARDTFRELLQIRASSTLFRLRSTDDIVQRLRFFNTGKDQVPTLIAARIDGTGYPGARFKAVSYLINVDKAEHSLTVAEMKGRSVKLHPVQAASRASFDAATGTFTVPARSAVVFVE